LEEDSELLVEKIMSLSPEKQDQNLREILGEWPNTYTFTKSMAERTLKKKNPAGLSMVILRPAIIIGSYNEPL
jgi:alcohol-forming fatty acyl-CoA reductase